LKRQLSSEQQLKKHRKRVRKFFQKAAYFYDFFVEPFLGKRVGQGVDLLGEIKNCQVLDVCTGTGILAREIWRRGALVTAVDITPNMLKKARQKVQEGIDWRLMDASCLEFPDDYFDHSCISMALHEMPDLLGKQVLQEMKRVTKEQILVIDYAAPPPTLLSRLGIALVEKWEGSYYQDFLREGLPGLLVGTGLWIKESQRDQYLGFYLLGRIED
jgi:ubiquinone/menaquinone biosynthesis C-methylase UbiE